MSSGAFLIDKPPGLTSSSVVTQLKWAMINHGYAERGFRIGHGGTLDPFATGVLIVLFGEATKLADTYLHSVKAYDGIIQLGAQTDTGDPTGQVIQESAFPSLTAKQWEMLAKPFTEQDYYQVPPMYSAKKQGGVALHTLAREGITVERAAILKRITHFKLIPEEEGTLYFQVECESGTYVRVLAEDLAKSAGMLAHLKTLRRTKSSDCLYDACSTLALTLENLERKEDPQVLKNFRSFETLASHLPAFPISGTQASRLKQGIKSEAESFCRELEERNISSRYALAKLGVQLVALFEKPIGFSHFRMQRVFN